MMARKRGRGAAIQAAIDRLASLFEYGALQADTDPAAFLNAAADEIAALRARAERAERWQEKVADGLGYLNRPEGQGGYEVAEPSVIIEAWRGAEAVRDELEARAERAEEALRRVEELAEGWTHGDTMVLRASHTKPSVYAAALRIVLAAPPRTVAAQLAAPGLTEGDHG